MQILIYRSFMRIAFREGATKVEQKASRGETSSKLLHRRKHLEVPSSRESSFVSFVLREELLIGE